MVQHDSDGLRFEGAVDLAMLRRYAGAVDAVCGSVVLDGPALSWAVKQASPSDKEFGFPGFGLATLGRGIFNEKFVSMKATFRHDDIVAYFEGVDSHPQEDFVPRLSSVERFRVRSTAGEPHLDFYFGVNVARQEDGSSCCYLRCYRSDDDIENGDADGNPLDDPPTHRDDIRFFAICFILEASQYESVHMTRRRRVGHLMMRPSEQPLVSSLQIFRSPGPRNCETELTVFGSVQLDEKLRGASRDLTDFSLTTFLIWRAEWGDPWESSDSETVPLQLQFEGDMGGGESLDGGAVSLDHAPM